ncbi:MAG: amidase domain-containing protein [Caloramator sp.]|nr:amidase domain-containing protein [Caloramator sp.]
MMPKKNFYNLIFASLILIISIIYFNSNLVFKTKNIRDEIEHILNINFKERCSSFITGNYQNLENQFDLSSKYGKWSFEHEKKRVDFINKWCSLRKIKLVNAESKIKILSIKENKNSIKVYLSDITKIGYIYLNQDEKHLNEFSYGTKHSITLIYKNGNYFITSDWYNDPLDDTIQETGTPAQNIIESEASKYTWVKYDRKKAVEYADKYCGANFYIEDGYKYNKKYRNFADLGGDCANFASQVLSDKEAGGIKMGGGWLYRNGEASASWVNAGFFTYHMLYSGKAKLISKGKYSKVVNSVQYLSPGDIISYQRKNDIVHVSIVTAIDSIGVPLVNSHTNDRYHVPWDLGWNSNDITFWFLKING